MNQIRKKIVMRRHRIPFFFHRIREYGIWLNHLLLNRYRLSRKGDAAPFFIIGCGRSGTTLVRSLLASHSHIAIPPESYVLQAVFLKFRLYRFMAWDDLVRIIVSTFHSHQEFFQWNIDLAPVYRILFDLPKRDRTLARIITEIYLCYSREVFPGKEIWGDKTPLNTLYLPWINRIFPKAKYIHVVRDGRDVVTSYLKTGLIGDIEEACYRWNESINRALVLAGTASPGRYLEIKYECLVNNLQQETLKMCNFLGVSFESEMLNREAVTSLGDIKNLSHHKKVWQPVTQGAVGHWVDNLTPGQKKLVQSKLATNLRRLKYPVNNE